MLCSRVSIDMMQSALSALHNVEQEVEKHFGTIDGRLTTLTMYFKLLRDFHCESGSTISIKRIVDVFEDNKLWKDICSKSPCPEMCIHVRIPGQKKNKKSKFKAFFNSLAISFCMEGVKGSIVAKVFASGVHVTGCKSVESCENVLKCLLFIINKCCGDVYEGGETAFAIVSHQIQMINILCCLADKHIPLMDLYDSLCSREDCVCLYDRESYSGLRIKWSDGVRSLTLLCFQSGKIICTGAKHADDIVFLRRLVDTYVVGDVS